MYREDCVVVRGARDNTHERATVAAAPSAAAAQQQPYNSRHRCNLQARCILHEAFRTGNPRVLGVFRVIAHRHREADHSARSSPSDASALARLTPRRASVAGRALPGVPAGSESLSLTRALKRRLAHSHLLQPCRSS